MTAVPGTPRPDERIEQAHRKMPLHTEIEHLRARVAEVEAENRSRAKVIEFAIRREGKLLAALAQRDDTIAKAVHYFASAAREDQMIRPQDALALLAAVPSTPEREDDA